MQLVDGLAQARRICSVHGPWVALQRQWSKLGRVVLGFCPATCMLAVSKISIAGVSRYDILRMHQYVTLCVVAASTYPRDVLLVGGPFLRPGLRLCCDLVLPGRRPLRILRAARLRSLYVLLVVWEYARGLNNQQIGVGHHNNKPMGASADERVGGLHETHIMYERAETTCTCPACWPGFLCHGRRKFYVRIAVAEAVQRAYRHRQRVGGCAGWRILSDTPRRGQDHVHRRKAILRGAPRPAASYVCTCVTGGYDVEASKGRRHVLVDVSWQPLGF